MCNAGGSGVRRSVGGSRPHAVTLVGRGVWPQDDNVEVTEVILRGCRADAGHCTRAAHHLGGVFAGLHQQGSGRQGLAALPGSLINLCVSKKAKAAERAWQSQGRSTIERIPAGLRS